MAQPATREEFRKYGLRQLGEPVVQVNVAKVQQEDLIDDSLQYFHEYAFEGLVRHMVPYQLTAMDLTNGYIDLPPYILSVARVFPMVYGNNKNPLNIPINFTIADLRYSLGSLTGQPFDIINYVESKQYMQMVTDLINGAREYEFSNVQNRLTIFAPLKDLMDEGEYLMLDTYRTVDPADFSRVWNHLFLKRYYVARLKKQWGENLKKFGGMKLPGGVELNGKEIFDEGVAELEKLEEDVYTKYSEPPHFFTG